MNIEKELNKSEEGRKLLPSLEQVEVIKAKLKGEDKNTIITLKECIDIVDDFIIGDITIDELEKFGSRMTVRAYIPILEKMGNLMAILAKYEVSTVETTEIKMVELYKHIFFSIVLKLYGQIQFDEIEDKNLMTYENYDKLFPIFNQYILSFCKTDYDVFMGMFNDCVSWNGVNSIVESMENIDNDKLNEAINNNKNLVESLQENKEMVRDLKDIILAQDNITKEVVKEIKKQTVSDVMKENDLENKMKNNERDKNKIINDINFNKDDKID